MELVRDFLKENLMVLVFGAVLFGFVFLGSLANMRMDYSVTENILEEVEYLY